jgi:thiamine-phosphate pyrophosphorylase
VTDSCQLYLVTPPTLDLATFPDFLAAALDAGPVGCVQLRLPGADSDAISRAAEALRPIVQDRDIAFLVNGSAALAKQLGADGVHLDSVDDVAAARRLLGELSVGVSCNDNAQRALDAGDDGADYVSFGPFFAGGSSPETTLAEIETLTWWASAITLPTVAIGGINAANCAPLVTAGADFIAVVSAVWAHPDGPAAGVKAMIAAIDKAG